MKLLGLVSFIFFVASVRDTLSAPVASSYDQRQTGDFNLKFEVSNVSVIAVLGSMGDMFGGEYDYSYDYTDFTIKPITSKGTTSAPDSSPSSTPSVKPWHTWPTVAPSPAPTTVLEAEENPEKPASPAAEVSGTIDANQSQPETESEGVESGSAAVIIPSSAPALSDDKPEVIPTSETEVVTAEKEKTGEADSLSNDKDTISAVAESQTAASSEENPTSAASVQENSETLTSPTQSSSSARKCHPKFTLDQEGRCRRLHTRRRVPSSFLPFGLRLTPRIQNRLRDSHPETTV